MLLASTIVKPSFFDTIKLDSSSSKSISKVSPLWLNEVIYQIYILIYSNNFMKHFIVVLINMRKEL